MAIELNPWRPTNCPAFTWFAPLQSYSTTQIAWLLPTADGLGTATIRRLAGKPQTCELRWLERFMAECVDGLLHETTRPSRIAPLALEIAEGMVAPNLTNALGESTQLAADKIASASGISASVVRRLWKYPNKNGGPDRRFADNRQLPICLYKSIHLTSPTCLDELSQVSKAELTRQSAGALRALGATNGGEEGKLALAQL